MRLRLFFVFLIIVVALFALPRDQRGLDARAEQPAAKAEKAPAKIAYSGQVVPLLQKYCVTCHGGEKPRAGFSLEKIKTDEQAKGDRKTWEKVITALQAREMPPAKKPQPTAAERDLLMTYLDQQLAVVDCTKQRDPGRVTIRRLNRTEYNNTIRDLLAVDFKPAEDFPADDIGYGFDNVGDVLTLSPLLLEKYLAAAERITREAIYTGPLVPPTRRYARNELSATVDAPSIRDGNIRVLAKNGELYRNHTFKSAGEHTFRVRAFGDQVGKDPVKMAIKVDGNTLQTFDVKVDSGGFKPGETFELKANVTAATRKVSVAFLNEFSDPKAEDAKKKERKLNVAFLEIVAPLPELFPESHKRIFVAMPAEKVTKEEAARKIVENMARRAFRRPVTAAEVERYLRPFKLAQEQKEPFEKSVELSVQAILVSPHFLFRIEKDPAGAKPQAAYPVSEFELASRMSYFLWSTMPDDELFDLAGKNALRKNLEAQVRRMLKDPKAKALTANFAGQWLQTRNLQAFAPDPKIFPEFDDELRSAMAKEAELFFEAIVEEDRNILDFLDADFTFVNNRLARHYGIKDVYGRDFRRVSLKGTDRGGVLTMAGVLTVTSNPTRTSPVKRGKWVLENLLNAPPPPPPPDVPELKEEPVLPSAGLRKRLEAHRAKPDCAVCHAKMDPIGFALENFDGIGGWRMTDGKHQVDASGELPSGETFKGPKELKAILKKQPERFSRCLTEKMLTYGLGKGLDYNDWCAVDDILRALVKDEYRLSRLVVEIVKSDPFQYRRAK